VKTSNLKFSFLSNVYIYIYIYVCVCVCVCVEHLFCLRYFYIKYPSVQSWYLRTVVLLCVFIFPSKLRTTVRTSVHFMILTLYFRQQSCYASNFFDTMAMGVGSGELLLVCGCSCRNPSAISGSRSSFISPLFFYVFICTIALASFFVTTFFFSFLVITTNITSTVSSLSLSFVYSFIHIFFLLTLLYPSCHPTRYQNMISVRQGLWLMRMPFPIQPTETQSFRRKWYS
jgi:hypothetical protein